MKIRTKKDYIRKITRQAAAAGTNNVTGEASTPNSLATSNFDNEAWLRKLYAEISPEPFISPLPREDMSQAQEDMSQAQEDMSQAQEDSRVKELEKRVEQLTAEVAKLLAGSLEPYLGFKDDIKAMREDVEFDVHNAAHLQRIKELENDLNGTHVIEVEPNEYLLTRRKNIQFPTGSIAAMQELLNQLIGEVRPIMRWSLKPCPFDAIALRVKVAPRGGYTGETGTPPVDHMTTPANFGVKDFQTDEPIDFFMNTSGEAFLDQQLSSTVYRVVYGPNSGTSLFHTDGGVQKLLHELVPDEKRPVKMFWRNHITQSLDITVGQSMEDLTVIGEHVRKLPPAHRVLCLGLLDDQRFLEWPGSTSYHHAYRGGLFQHTLEVLKIAWSLHQMQAEVGHLSSMPDRMNWENLCTAIIWHDYGKIFDYKKPETPGGAWTKTAHCKQVGHLCRSYAEFMSRCNVTDPKMSDADRDHIGSLILSHHGRSDWGSPVLPVTREAWAIHLADMASSRVLDPSPHERSPLDKRLAG